MKQPPPDIHLSIIIPAFNEARRIEPTLDKLTAYLDKQSYKSEVLVVVDGSQDQTLTRVSRAALWRQYINVLDNRVSRGKGFAVRRGMLSARGKYLLFTEADLPTPIDQIERLMQALEEGNDVAIGSRWLPGSDVTAHHGWWHRAMRGLFAGVARVTLLRGIRDPMCGFKLFPRAGALNIFPRQLVEGFAFDVEILWIARRNGYRVAEAATSWGNHPESRVGLVLDYLRMYVDLVRIRLNDWRGAYVDADPAEPATDA